MLTHWRRFDFAIQEVMITPCYNTFPIPPPPLPSLSIGYWELGQVCIQRVKVLNSVFNAVVTPLRKAASYEQRKTNLGNKHFRPSIIT